MHSCGCIFCCVMNCFCILIYASRGRSSLNLNLNLNQMSLYCIKRFKNKEGFLFSPKPFGLKSRQLAQLGLANCLPRAAHSAQRAGDAAQTAYRAHTRPKLVNPVHFLISPYPQQFESDFEID
jgi:hypothetical protein